MSFKNFGIQVVLRLLLVTTGLFGFLYYSYIELNYIRIFFIGVFIIIVVAELFYYINRTNKDTSNFLQAIIHNDFTIKYSAENKGASFRHLYQTFNKVNDKFIEVSQKEATEYQYLNTLIHQLKVGIISFDDKGRIGLANDSIKSLLDKEELINLDSIKRVNSDLFDTIKRLKGGQSEVLKVTLRNKVYQLAINASIFKLRQQNYKLISVQDIRGELDENEMGAWQKLIRVLTHEIMNSVAPITSLSGTLNTMVSRSKDSGVPLTSSELSSLHDGLDAIENRSDGLMNFTQAYRSLTRIPLPNIKATEGRLYFQRIISLFTPTLTGCPIQFRDQLPDHEFALNIDPDLMEQVFINLLKNAKEAVLINKAEGGKIDLIVECADKKEEACTVIIKDNGGGIPKDIREKIFIPFYTTKDQGSGVGLSLVRQIIQLHKAEILLEADEKEGSTEFRIML